jgi:hypothetical protein
MKANQLFRKILCTAAAMIVFVSAAMAQVSKDSLFKIMTKEVCADISAKDFTGKSMDEIQMELGLAFLPVLGKYNNELKEIYGEDAMGKDGMEKVGEELGMRMVMECPAFLKMMASNEEVLKQSKKDNGITTAVSGTLVRIVPGEFTHLLVKDNNGKLVKIWWMESFEGSEKLTSSPQKWLNKKVMVSYVEQESYSAALKKYTKAKIASGIEKK